VPAHAQHCLLAVRLNPFLLKKDSRTQLASSVVGVLAPAAARTMWAFGGLQVVKLMLQDEGPCLWGGGDEREGLGPPATPVGGYVVGVTRALSTSYTHVSSRSATRSHHPQGPVVLCSLALLCMLLLLLSIQVAPKVHVYGHSHRCIDTPLRYTLPAPQMAPSTAHDNTVQSVGSSIAGPVEQQRQPVSSSSSSQPGLEQQEQQGSCRFVQYALDAVGAEAAGLYCIWDGHRLAPAGHVVPIS